MSDLGFQFSEEDLLAVANQHYSPPDSPPATSSTDDTASGEVETPDDEEIHEESSSDEVEDEEVVDDNEDETPDESVEGFSLTLPDGSQVTLTPAQALAYYQFDQRLSSDPAFSQYLHSYDPASRPGGGGVEQVPPPESTPPPPTVNLDELDLEDPTIKYLVDSIKGLEQKLNPLQEVAARHEQLLTQEQQAQANALVSSAQQSFRQRYTHLSEDEVVALTHAAARTGMVNSYMSGVHPITGLPVPPNPLEAMSLALETVYWSNPEYRQHALAEQTRQAREDRARKRKAGSLSGPSGISNKAPAVPRNEKERIAAMTAVVAQDMGLE